MVAKAGSEKPSGTDRFGLFDVGHERLVEAGQHGRQLAVFRCLQHLVLGNHVPEAGDVVGKGVCEIGPADSSGFGHGATIKGRVLRRQDIAAQGIVHHVRLEVAAQRMLHDRALVEPRDQLGHIPEPGAAHRDDGERERDSSDAGPAVQIGQLSDHTGAVPSQSNQIPSDY